MRRVRARSRKVRFPLGGHGGLATEQAHRYDFEPWQQVIVCERAEEPGNDRIEHVDPIVAQTQQVMIARRVAHHIEGSRRRRAAESLFEHGPEIGEGARAMEVRAPPGRAEVHSFSVGRNDVEGCDSAGHCSLVTMARGILRTGHRRDQDR
jgi:hypothetical protein